MPVGSVGTTILETERMRIHRMPAGALALVLALAALPATATEDATERWYEVQVNGQKQGYFQVVWAPSTWEGKKTLHDTTTQVTKSVRNMMGVKDVFETTQTVDIERDADGSLWWQRVRVEEATRVTTEELTWTGKGYRHVAQLGDQKEQVIEVATETPVMTDSESFLGHLLRAGKLEVGAKFEMPTLNVRARRVDKLELTILEPETIADESGEDVQCVRVRERHPESGSESTMWLDPAGAFVRIQSDSGMRISRVPATTAKKMPVRPAEMRITTPSYPTLERSFSADRLWVDLHLQADSTRKLPKFPDSPWSRVLGVEGSEKDGWVFKLELRKYDSQEKTATIPVTDEVFTRDLESTVLMQSDHPRIKAIAKEAIGDETDARRAAHKLARFVIEFLRDKSSPDVAQASALEILDLRCGDCSEHGLLFVTLCRAAGIPARRCSGYVNIGSAWGAHAWAEIWTGQWIAADPTTGEIGGGARYLFFGYGDQPGSYPGVISSRVRGRMRFIATKIQEGEAIYDLSDSNKHRIHDPEGRRYLHVLCGLEIREIPDGWSASLSGTGSMTVRGGEVSTFRAGLTASADQGYTYEYWASPRRRGQFLETTFGGAPALVARFGNRRIYRIFSRRRQVVMNVHGASTDDLAKLERCLKPGLVEVPAPWPETAPPKPSVGDKEPDAAEDPPQGDEPDRDDKR
jgi:transglutaminase-like putative cysteine protease